MPRANTKPVDLTPESFRGLLAFLDPDPDRAAENYEKVREKLIRLFEWKGCLPGDQYADETFDRVARKLEQGLEEAPGNPYLYLHGVAVNIAREYWRKTERTPKTVSISSVSTPELAARESVRADAVESERRLECLETCVERLSPTNRELLTAYHMDQAEGGGLRIGGRRSLAQRLNIAADVLRLRVYRIRKSLAGCVVRCAERQEKQVES